MLYKSLQFLSENISTSFFTDTLIVFVCLSLYLRFYENNLQFYQFSYVIIHFIIDNQMEIFRIKRIYLHIPFLLHSNCVFMPIIEFEIFLRKSSISSVILCHFSGLCLTAGFPAGPELSWLYCWSLDGGSVSPWSYAGQLSVVPRGKMAASPLSPAQNTERVGVQVGPHTDQN